uniref:Uncharacterized protein n=2 Tax=Gracilariopsis TaxID=2781 RepID=A0A1C9CEV0_9FLOR|nr:hypothetical protein [Gracilariopsis lemaneiformis]YP_009294653.1 hypothetical protein Gch_054 [Gracilariopsis chorda]AJO68547.1 hypothetical protein [Gracilariopsis lemaneiformis]AML79820.1 hypothetical protein [Gracilariopsis lemaneiformis]AOM66913.1 hypothetical protein Gch_054 [Gracilariopsis chorda]
MILNLNELEAGISFLKQGNIIKNFNYRIHYHSKGLVVNIRYNLNNHHLIYLYNEYNTNILQNNQSKISNLLKKIMYFLKSFSINKIVYKINQIANVTYKDYSFFKLEYAYFWNFIKNLKIQIDRSTTFNKINIELSDLKIINYISHICILYSHYNLYYPNYKSIFNYIKIINSNSFIKKISGLQIKIKYLTIKVKYNLGYNINIIQKLTIQYGKEYIKYIYRYCKLNSIIQRLDIVYTISKIIEEQKLYISLQLINQIINDKHIYNIAIYPYFNLLLLIYLNLNHIEPTIYIPDIYQHILLNYNLIINLPPILPNIQKNTCILKLKFNIYNLDKYLLLRQLNNNYTNLKNVYNYEVPYGIHYLLNAEYKIYTMKYISTYIFMNYIKNFSYRIHSLHNLNDTKLLYKNHIIIGIGIQLKQISKLGFEYYITDQNEKFFHISTYFN